jgi:hypothetical protein
MKLKVGLDASFDNTYDWKGIPDKTGFVEGRKVYVTNDEISRWVINGCSSNPTMNGMLMLSPFLLLA